MPSPIPKPAHVRQRRNRTSTNAVLPRQHDVTAPPLPEIPGGWSPAVTQWWADVWSSPMAVEFEQADAHGLYVLARLREDFERTPLAKPRQRVVLASEIRLGEARFGLAPIDRRRLQWQVEAAESAMDKGRQRRARTLTPVDPDDDPRNLLGKL